MSHFIVIFDHLRRADAEVIRVEDPAVAVARLFELEKELRDDKSRGVVMGASRMVEPKR